MRPRPYAPCLSITSVFATHNVPGLNTHSEQDFAYTPKTSWCRDEVQWYTITSTRLHFTRAVQPKSDSAMSRMEMKVGSVVLWCVDNEFCSQTIPRRSSQHPIIVRRHTPMPGVHVALVARVMVVTTFVAFNSKTSGRVQLYSTSPVYFGRFSLSHTATATFHGVMAPTY